MPRSSDSKLQVVPADYKLGGVIGQDPPGGTVVDPGSTVTLVIGPLEVERHLLGEGPFPRADETTAAGRSTARRSLAAGAAASSAS